LAESQAELERAQAVAKIGNWAYDVATDTMRSSARNSRIIGVPDGTSWTSESFMLHIHPDDRSAVRDDWLGFAKGGVFDREHRIMVEGEIRWIRQTAEMAFDRDGKPLRATGITHDVTDRKSADLALLASQTRLQEYSDSLERKVLERTRELDDLNRTLDERVHSEIGKRKEQESLLIHQSRLAAMGEMIGAIAHQWRQPLNAISLVLQNMLLQHNSGVLTDESMGRMQNKAQLLVQRMSLTIDEFRDLFKPGKRAEAFNLANAIRTTADIMDGTFTGHAVSLALECDESIELVGIKGEFSQVMLNLLSNADDAIQSNQPDSPCVTIRALRCGDRIQVEVEDNAGGIAPNLLEKIFEPYFTTKDEGKGTGIGLYLSKMIVENNMHGQLRVANAEKGARFTLDLPLAS
jgi:C4-dicarboxylate-specific signal transduction histidine kinase